MLSAGMAWPCDADAAPRPHGTHKYGLVRMAAFELNSATFELNSDDPCRCGSCRWVPRQEDYWQDKDVLVQCRWCAGYRCSWCRLDDVAECANCPVRDAAADDADASAHCPADASAEAGGSLGNSPAHGLGASSPKAAASPAAGLPSGHPRPGQEAEHGLVSATADIEADAQQPADTQPETASNDPLAGSPHEWSLPRFNWWHAGQFDYMGSHASEACRGDRKAVYCTICRVTFNRGQEGTHGGGRRHSQLLVAPPPEPFCPLRAKWCCNSMCSCQTRAVR